jgi:hypothetical protein
LVISNVPFKIMQGSDTGKEMEFGQQSCSDFTPLKLQLSY